MKTAKLLYLLGLVVPFASAAPPAEPTDAFIYQLKESLVKVAVNTKSGGHGSVSYTHLDVYKRQSNMVALSTLTRLSNTS